MKILVLAPELPYPPFGGGRLRAYHLLRRLAERHELTILCFLHDPSERDEVARVAEWAEVESVDWSPPPAYVAMENGVDPSEVSAATDLPFLAAYFTSPAMRGLVDATLARGRYDIIYAVTSMMGQYLPHTPAAPAAVDLWNLETLVQRRAWERSGAPLDREQYEKTAAYEADVFARCAVVLPVSSKEREDVRRMFGHPNVVNIDNGVDTRAFQPAPVPAGPRLLFTGTMNYQPNPEGILHFLESAWPTVRSEEPEATLTIVGQNPPDSVLAHHGGKVTVTGLVPEVQPYMEAARVCIVPLLSGGGTRLKILEAMAAGRPVVSTSIGAEGLAAVDGEHLLIADNDGDFAAAVLRVLRDDELAQRLAGAGRRLVVERYDWDIIAAHLEETLLRAPGSPTPA